MADISASKTSIESLPDRTLPDKADIDWLRRTGSGDEEARRDVRLLDADIRRCPEYPKIIRNDTGLSGDVIHQLG